ncbi:AraC family transcriptional regulator [Alcanivorax sp. 1008]|uniref:helix-turn-helix transcriptional regulator n=1 Tax=Alcanivorax sp. 1008 TaxID=2816853 RepID=UPI001D5235BC|nr:AraC family transcriptional regulator [Alcanivorax sp. 1008]MCC1497827.1 AraC family transcriptional regulator ligand-binding domain-containing protein [Alcanivorax sp. 1008]
MTPTEALTASRYFAGVQQMLAERGVPVGSLLEGTSISEGLLGDAGGFIGLEDQDRFLANAIRLGANRQPGLALGRRLNISAHGSAGYAGLTAANARSALQVAVRFFPLISQLVQLSVTEDQEFASVQVTPLPGLSQRCEDFMIQTLFSSISLMAGFLLGNQAASLRLEMPGEPDDAILAGLAEVRDGLRFGCSGYRIRIPLAILDTPFALADAAAHHQAITRCEQELSALEARRSISARLYQQLLLSEEAIPSLEQLAEQMQMSSRTLHRRLEAEGQRFRDLANSARMSKAAQLLDQGWSVTDIAYQLGYGDSANFTRAFRRHYQVPPSRFAERSSEEGKNPIDGTPPL